MLLPYKKITENIVFIEYNPYNAICTRNNLNANRTNILFTYELSVYEIMRFIKAMNNVN